MQRGYIGRGLQRGYAEGVAEGYAEGVQGGAEGVCEAYLTCLYNHYRWLQIFSEL